MNKLNVAVIAGLFALAAVLGTVAATRTTSLGAARQQSVDATVRARTQQLDRFEASLQRALAKRPPALPAAQPPRAANVAVTPRVVYHRPPPIVVVRHVHHGDDGAREAEGDGGDA